MELKNVNVVASNLINIKFLFFLNCENQVQKSRSYFVFSKKCHDCPKKKILILFNSQTNIEWIKAFHVDMDLFHEKK
jgi:hypothetical protein